jgi:hypothetical protein
MTRAHSLAKAALFLTPSFAWLIGALYHKGEKTSLLLQISADIIDELSRACQRNLSDYSVEQKRFDTVRYDP